MAGPFLPFPWALALTEGKTKQGNAREARKPALDYNNVCLSFSFFLFNKRQKERKEKESTPVFIGSRRPLSLPFSLQFLTGKESKDKTQPINTGVVS